jgi:hypothetical protein
MHLLFSGISPDFGRIDFMLNSSCTDQTFYIEVAANERFGAGDGGMIEPPNPNKYFTLKQANIALFYTDIYQLLMDFDILLGMATLLPKTMPRHYQALYTANHMVNEDILYSFELSLSFM